MTIFVRAPDTPGNIVLTTAVHNRCLREAPALHAGAGSSHVAACHGASWPAAAPAVLAA